MFAINGKHNKKELNFWVMPNAGFATRDVLRPFIEEFEKENDVTVRLTIHPWSLTWSRIMDVLKGRYPGPLPDVLQVGTTWVATLTYLGALEKVPGAEVFPEENRNSAYVWDPGVQNEQEDDLSCVPWFIDVRVLYYRRDLFEKLGIPVDWLRDWKGFFKTCLELKRYLSRSGVVPKILAPIGMSGQHPGVLMHDIAPWIWAAGGDFVSDDLSACSMKTPEAMAGFEFYYDLINQGFMGVPESIEEQNRLGCSFFSGHFAMQFSGAWPVGTFFNKNWPYSDPEVIEGFGTALIPAGPKGRFSFLGGSNLGVFSQSPDKELAWKLIKFLGHPNRQLEHARGIGALTARLAAFEQLFDLYPDQKKVFWDSLGHARRLPRLVELGSVEQIIYNMGLKILHHIRTGSYHHKKLQSEVEAANVSVDKVLSLHRYAVQTAAGAAE